MNKLTLFEEYRLIERSEAEVNGAWKDNVRCYLPILSYCAKGCRFGRDKHSSAHLLLFFMAFVFGSFCTFCFHMLMYLFDEKCVLFPKLLSLTSLKHNVIYEFLPVDKDAADMLPLDFLGTQWVEKSACYLPTYVPLISGIFGLVWTTMFLMCSTGSRTLTGLQRPWRVLPPVFVFSLAMGLLCTYSSCVTHYGLDELCHKLGEITGSATCTYTVNVATLAYERRIRGVYQAIQLTILSAWLHTICWLLSALLTLARVVLAVDFQLVRINVNLIGNIDKYMEKHEKQIHIVSPPAWSQSGRASPTSPPQGNTTRVHFKRHSYPQPGPSSPSEPTNEDVEFLYSGGSQILYVSEIDRYESEIDRYESEMGLLPEETLRLSRMTAYKNIPKDKHFIVKIVYDLLMNMPKFDTSSSILTLSEDSFESVNKIRSVARQLGRSKLDISDTKRSRQSLANQEKAEEVAKEIRQHLHEKQLIHLRHRSGTEEFPRTRYEDESVLNITDEMKKILEHKSGQSVNKTSRLKHVSAQTDAPKAKTPQKVHIKEPDESEDTATSTSKDIDKETQTDKKKEKQE